MTGLKTMFQKMQLHQGRWKIIYLSVQKSIIKEFSKEKDLEKLKKRLSYWLGTYWLQFDDAYLKPKLICNWPEVKKEHDEIAEVITDVIKNYLEEKKKIKEDNNNENEEGNEMNEGLINYDKNEEFKTTYMKLRDDQDENDNK